jgi:hypothetical protein
MDRDELSALLREAIRNAHGGDPRWVESVQVYLAGVDKRTWSGSVEVFVLDGHPSTPLVYAWRDGHDGQPRVVLHGSGIDSPRAAVRSAGGANGAGSDP